MTVAINVSPAGVISTYTDLKDAITEETDGRANETSLARFVRSTESYVGAILRRNPIRPMMTNVAVALDGETVRYPADLIKPYSVEMVMSGGTRELDYVEPEDIARLQIIVPPDTIPDRYTIDGDALRVWPIPTQVYSATLRYYQTLSPLGDDSPSNWMLDNFPNVYLEGGLYYAYRDMPDVAKAEALKGLFDESIQQMLDSYPAPANRTRLGVDTMLTPRFNSNCGSYLL